MKDWTKQVEEMDAREQAAQNWAAAKVRVRDRVIWEDGEVFFSGIDREALRQMGVED